MARHQLYNGNYNFLLQCLAIILLVCSDTIRCDQSSRIVFENGLYNDISIAFDNNVNETEWGELINAINETFFEASGFLNEVTERPAAFGTIRVLVPHIKNCTGWTEASVRDTYEAADIKISSSHPISSSLPWAEQQGGCGRTGNAIFIPPSFFTGGSFNAQERGRIFTHEWLKFRYGVFEEFGFLNDNFYLPCYKRNGSIYFTGCTSPVLPSFEISNSLNLSPGECQKLINDNLAAIENQLSTVSSSLMFSPLPRSSSDQIGGTCSNTTHNWYANTKQNVQCYRKSSSEVIQSHKDFQNIQLVKEHVQNQRRTENVNVAPKIELVMHCNNDIEQGYAFVIENSENIRKFNRLTHIKQSIVEFVELIDGTSKPHGYTLTYNGQFYVSGSDMQIDDGRKESFLFTIPDQNSSPIRASFKNLAFETVNRTEIKSLKILFQTLKDNLDKTESYRKWNVIFISSLPPSELTEALAILRSTDYSVSVVTFDDSEEWLKWNSIPQTRKLLRLPVCFHEVNNVTCSAKTSSLLTDHLLEILSDQQPNRRVFQKIVELEIQGHETVKSFQVPRLSDGSNDKNFFFFFPLYSESTTVKIISPNNQECTGQPLLNYDRLLIFKSEQSGEPCAFQAGTWTLQVDSANSEASHILRGFVQSAPQEDLVILPSFDDDLSKEIFCSTQNLFVPLHVIVKTVNDHPVVKAKVIAEIVYENNTRIVNTILNLLDDGLDPDTTKDDGIYSAFVQGFSPVPAYHSGSISVTTPDDSRSIERLSLENKAMLFDDRMNEKCCGSYIPIDSSLAVQIGPTFYSVTLPSFKTGVAIPNPSDFPPSKIGIVNVLEETTEMINLNFIAPGSSMNTGRVHHYDLCVFDDLTEDLCQDIDTGDCSPVPAGREQNCKVYKSQLQSLLSSEVHENRTVGDVIVITCRLRGVNSANINGPFSSFLVEVRLTASSAGLEECKSISDGCLPIEIFWILIGCLAGILLILVIVSCCWFWRNRRRGDGIGDKKRKESHHDKWKTSNSHNNHKTNHNGGSFGKSLRSKDITHRPFDDEFDSKEFYRTSFRNNNNIDSSEAAKMSASKPLDNKVRRRSISAGEITTKFQPTSDISMHDNHHGHVMDEYRDSDEMPVFFSNGTVGTSSAQAGRPRTSQYYNSSFKNQPRMNYRPPQQQQQQLEHRDHHKSYNNSNSNNTRNSQLNDTRNSQLNDTRNSQLNDTRNSQLNDTRNSGLDFVYPNQFNQNSANGAFALPSISSTIDLQMSNESFKSRDHHPVYASVNRNGRKSGTTPMIGGDNHHHNSGLQLPPHTVEYRNNNNNSRGNHATNKTHSYLGPQGYNSNTNNGNDGPYKNQQSQSRPQSSQSLDSGFVISHSQTLPPPPIRMDHFPSSESETYSEMSRGGPEPASSPPPPPPPMPNPNSTLVSRSRPHSSVVVAGHMGGGGGGGGGNRNSNSQYMMMDDDIPPSGQQQQPRPRSKTPPSTSNGLGILAKMGPIPDRHSVLKKPRQNPPPPPPPRSSLKKPAAGGVGDYDQPAYKQPVNSLLPNSYELRKTNNQIDSDRENDNNSDDDSDEWDVYDDFEFSPPGVSHV